MRRGVRGLIGLSFLGLVLSATAAGAVTGYLGAGFDIFTDGSLRVREVAPGSPAERAGMKPGDIVQTIDGKAPGSGEEIVAQMKAAQPGQAMAFTLRRGEQTLAVRTTLIDHGKAAPGAPTTAPSAAAGDTKAYCKAMYARAYSLCGTLGDRDCKFLAADKWEQCEKTGRWP